MTDDELDRLADLIARSLLAAGSAGADGARRPRSTSWVLAPIRPEPPTRVNEPPPWTGAAQNLDDVAPSGGRVNEPRHRISTAELARATRAAAAGMGTPPQRPGRRTERESGRPRARNAAAVDVRIGVSNRHVHLSPAHLQALFGGAPLTASRQLSQPGQFAAAEVVTVEGPKGRIDGVRIVGPARDETQLEIAASDGAVLGVKAPVAASGSLEGSAGGVTLVGPAGRLELRRGVIVAARHLHLAPDDARGWGFRDGDRLEVRCGAGARGVTFHDVLVRSGHGHATELHLDADEARSAGVRTGDTAAVIAWQSGIGRRRPLVTERDVVDLARTGARLPAGAILTPSARDRAAALGIILDR